MYRFRIFLALFSLISKSDGVIYKLNESEYYKMPRLYAMDDYDRCMTYNGTYCLIDFDLQGGTNKELLRQIQEYSEDKIKHFNYSQIHRGICLTTNCYDYLNKSDMNGTDSTEVLEACLNNSLYLGYGLEGKIVNLQYCLRADKVVDIDTIDFIVAVVYLVIVILNVIGSLYDIFCCKKDTGNPYLLAFSVPKNWARLTAPSTNKREPRLEILRVFNGMRTMTMICVIFSHTSLIISFSYVDNPLFIETAYDDPLKQLLFNGSLVIQTFFIMSSFLLSYNFMIHSEKHPVSWMHLPKGILLRWLRLTPTYALVLATIVSWMRHMYTGPLWDLAVTSESVACRQYWWAQLLYINNYIYDDAYCMPQTWYLAADTQLFCLGLLVCIVARSRRTKISTLSILMIVALLIVAGHVYFQDLDAVVIQSPEYYRNIYSTDPNFRLLYIRGHTNISSCVVGLSAGFVAYHWQNGKTPINAKKCRWAVWLSFPLGVAIILSGGLFYMDGVRGSILWRVLYATFHKPVFQMCLITVTLGCMFQFESVYKSILEWRGFTWTGRVSYSAFLLHTLFQRALVGAHKQPIYMSSYYVLLILSATVLMSYITAVPLYLGVEAPAAALTRAVFVKQHKHASTHHGVYEGTQINITN